MNMENSGQFKKESIPWNKGKKMTKEYCEKISIATKIGMSKPEVKIKILGENNSMYGKPSSMKGKKHTKESRKKMSEKLSGEKHPNFGKHLSTETKNKIRIGNYGHKVNYIKKSKPERFIESVLSVNGIKYEPQKNIYGRPDVFIEPNICIFVDGCYHHGCNTCLTIEKLTHNIPQKGIKRGLIVNKELTKQGYKVIRMWEHEINNDIMKCLDKIKRCLK